MKETDIRKYAKLMEELGLTGLEIAEENAKIRLERGVTAAVSASVPAENLSAAKEAAPGESNGCSSVKSPMVGVFYAAPAEDAAPYVSVGDRVKKGQTLCIVEAMKLLNEISAEEDGVIEEICVTNGQVVEYGTELFRIAREER
ncbi:MAG: acetyl-CoA carboxylase biotin carboxyl carrier protein [Lachnospiraceae bacterium]|nr:acetyl-CoA carboxylase biotin carboxyl carrier protein [Lachnospiraceae bacterium]